MDKKISDLLEKVDKDHKDIVEDEKIEDKIKEEKENEIRKTM